MFDKLKGVIRHAEYVTLIDRQLKKEHRKDNSIIYEFECDLFLCSEAGFLLLDQGKDILELVKGQKSGTPLNKIVTNVLKTGKTDLMYLIRSIMQEVFKPQYDFMNVEWIKKNLDLKQTVHIILQLLIPIVEYLQEMGYMGEVTEKATPTPKVEDIKI